MFARFNGELTIRGGDVRTTTCAGLRTTDVWPSNEIDSSMKRLLSRMRQQSR
jgi:hypothetical protein